MVIFEPVKVEGLEELVGIFEWGAVEWHEFSCAPRHFLMIFQTGFRYAYFDEAVNLIFDTPL